MNQQAFEDIQHLLTKADADFQVYTHPVCRTSEESARVRKDAGMPEAIGAKALVCKVTWRNGAGSDFAVFVLPGSHTIDKTKLRAGLPEMKEYRFATPDELLDLAGVVPGCMPPFGNQIFPKITKMFVSTALKNFERIAFNAAKLDTSITLPREQYMSLITPDKIFDYSNPK